MQYRNDVEIQRYALQGGLALVQAMATHLKRVVTANSARHASLGAWMELNFQQLLCKKRWQGGWQWHEGCDAQK